MRGVALLCIIIMIFLFWWLIQPTAESFVGMLGSRIHIVVSRDGEPLSFSYQQPSGDGINGCTQVPCPQGYPDRVTCWCCCNFH